MTTLGELLQPSDRVETDALAHGLVSAIGAGHLAAAGIPVPLGDISKALSVLLDLPLGDIAIATWHDHHQVLAAKQRTREHPGNREVVQLGEHKVSTSWQPELRVVVGTAVVGRPVKLDLTLEIVVQTVSLVIEDGNVTGVGPGPAKATARLCAAGRTLAHRDLIDVDLHHERRGAPRLDASAT